MTSTICDCWWGGIQWCLNVDVRLIPLKLKATCAWWCVTYLRWSMLVYATVGRPARFYSRSIMGGVPGRLPHFEVEAVSH